MYSAVQSCDAWADSEFGGVDLGDRRRRQRMIRMATAMVKSPCGTLPGSFPAWAETKAAYRLLDRPEATYERIVAPHQARVRAACREPGEYLLIEDTTMLDFTTHPATEGLGRIGDDGGRGFYVHSTLALQITGWTDRQAPDVTVIGLAAQHWWARTGPTIGHGETTAQRQRRPRESQRWAAAVEQIGTPPAGASWTYIADRESDIWEVFERCTGNGWHFIVRAEQARALADAVGSVYTAVAAGDEIDRYVLELRARPGVAARKATIAVRAAGVSLRHPRREDGDRTPIRVTLIEAREVDPPQKVDPIHWVLLSDWPGEGREQVRRVIETYRRRWLIEEYHKALKSGTHMERSQLSTAARLTALLGVLAVVAVRLLALKLPAVPEEPVAAETIGPDELAVLEAIYRRPPEGWTNHTVLASIAKLGGFPGRKGDGKPGWKTLWRGWERLMAYVYGYHLATQQRCG